MINCLSISSPHYPWKGLTWKETLALRQFCSRPVPTRQPHHLSQISGAQGRLQVSQTKLHSWSLSRGVPCSRRLGGNRGQNGITRAKWWRGAKGWLADSLVSFRHKLSLLVSINLKGFCPWWTNWLLIFSKVCPKRVIHNVYTKLTICFFFPFNNVSWTSFHFFLFIPLKNKMVPQFRDVLCI